ncbi:JAB domain-containing protein [Bacillus kwashiorkori]|uniref:JAB domain-containing protein n=1 Tax=Bacillus kwashiorkori TaxID=1522318 RepID=UPI00078475E2|nr:JAB domain-containing protein [Bacillus kwashiorkori]
MERINIYSIQLVKEKSEVYDLDNISITSPEDAAKAVCTVLNLHRSACEQFVVFTLNTKNEIIGVHPLFKGSLSSAIVHPREVFQTALLNNAASIICFHNHPSGSVSPSNQDIELTKTLQFASQIMGVSVLDHIIIGDENNYTSMKEKGYFEDSNHWLVVDYLLNL